jgi:integrase
VLCSPGLRANLDGQRSYPAGTYRQRLNQWLEDCDIRDEHGQPVHLTPHQWRHTLGTRLKMSGVASAASFGGFA